MKSVFIRPLHGQQRKGGMDELLHHRDVDHGDTPRSKMAAKFYEYVQQNHANNYVTPWSVWLKNHK